MWLVHIFQARLSVAHYELLNIIADQPMLMTAKTRIAWTAGEALCRLDFNVLDGILKNHCTESSPLVSIYVILILCNHAMY